MSEPVKDLLTAEERAAIRRVRASEWVESDITAMADALTRVVPEPPKPPTIGELPDIWHARTGGEWSMRLEMIRELELAIATVDVDHVAAAIFETHYPGGWHKASSASRESARERSVAAIDAILRVVNKGPK